MDYFLARYYSSAQGRFTSPDEFAGGPDELFDFADDASDNPTFYADLHEPQSLNKYQYCYNNPLSCIDPDGHKVVLKIRRLGGTSATGMVATAASIAQSPNPAVSAIGVGLLGLALIGDAIINRHPAPSQNVDTQGQAQAQAQPLAPPVPIEMARPIDKPRDDGHRQGKRDHNKHTKRHPGNKKPPNFKPRVPKRPQDRPPKNSEVVPPPPPKKEDPKPEEKVKAGN